MINEEKLKELINYLIGMETSPAFRKEYRELLDEAIKGDDGK